MTGRNVVRIIGVLASSFALAQGVGTNPCAARGQSETSPWRVYADFDHHFCFRYPKSYRPVPPSKATCLEPKLRDEKTKASVYVCAGHETFRLSALVPSAPTGIEAPPEALRIGENIFYYYGPGGGGVAYMDQYFFDLHGKLLSIDFDGPYEGDKTPTAETKKMERKVLASFREF